MENLYKATEFGCIVKARYRCGCGKPNAFTRSIHSQSRSSLACSRCGIARYCSLDCQLECWPVHKKDCRRQAQLTEMNRAEIRMACMLDMLGEEVEIVWADCEREDDEPVLLIVMTASRSSQLLVEQCEYRITTMNKQQYDGIDDGGEMRERFGSWDEMIKMYAGAVPVYMVCAGDRVGRMLQCKFD